MMLGAEVIGTFDDPILMLAGTVRVDMIESMDDHGRIVRLEVTLLAGSHHVGRAFLLVTSTTSMVASFRVTMMVVVIVGIGILLVIVS